jgi:hypothetical protein
LGRRTPRLEVVTLQTIADVELEADDRKEHGMGAIQQLAVDDRLDPDVRRNLTGASAVPTEAMTIFRFHGARLLP